jgi:mannose-6-phosphate isomerase-like protein (cupin superfamily)
MPPIFADPAADTIAAMGYHVADASTLDWEERPPGADGLRPRLAADVTTAAELKQSRGRIWRYPAGTRGRRHADKAQEEVFVVLSGQMTMLLGDPPERVDVGPQSVVAVDPGTPLQVRNETAEELVLYIYGAPPEQEGADFFEDIPEL